MLVKDNLLLLRLGGKRIGFCKIVFFLLLIVVISVASFISPCDASVTDIWCTSPWLSVLANFIGGIHISVHSMKDWDDDGENILVIPPKEILSSSFIVALDIPEAEECGIKKQEYPRLTTLYSKIPVDRDKVRSLFYDPSTLPFLALRVMNVLSNYDPTNYSYYQRRLAEFQTRLDSTVLVGKQLLNGTHILLINTDVSQIFVASGCDTQSVTFGLESLTGKEGGKNDKKLKEAYRKSLDDFADYLKEMRNNGIIPVIDVWTPRYLREELKPLDIAVMLPKPSLNMEFILFLNDHYLALWNEIRLLKH